MDTLDEFEYGMGRADLVFVQYDQNRAERRWKEGPTTPFPNEVVMQIFLSFSKTRGRSIEEIAEVTQSPLKIIRHVTRWLHMHRYLVGTKDEGRFRINSSYALHVHRAVAVEAKLRDWGKVLHQAQRAETFADYVYVALDKGRVKVTDQRLDDLRDRNIGLIMVDAAAGAERELRPLRSTPTSPLERLRLNESHFHYWHRRLNHGRSPTFTSQ